MSYLTGLIIQSAIEIHKQLGPELLESAYKQCLIYEFKRKGIPFEVEKPIPITYKEVHLEYGYRLDIQVDKRIVVEIKAVDYLHSIHIAQILTYMKLGGYSLGLIQNFNQSVRKDGIKRVVL